MKVKQHADAAVAKARDAKQQADHDRQHRQRANDGVAAQERKIGIDADRGADHRRYHGEREQHVGIAQHSVLLQGKILCCSGHSGCYRSQFRLHSVSPRCFVTLVRLGQKRKSCNC